MTDVTAALSVAMNNDMQELRTISQNLANVSTNGYKREVNYTTAFQRVLDETALDQSIAAGGRIDGTAPEIGAVRDMQQGAFKYSGNAFEVALQGDGFLSVSTVAGSRLTRKGEMKIDEQGRLSLVSGEPVLGEGGEIFLRNSPFSIGGDGVVMQDGVALDRLSLRAFRDARLLNYQGEGLYAVPADLASAERPFTGKVMQGYVETSNVKSADEMVRLVEITRHFETSQKVLSGYDGMLDKAINVLGDL
jgi:flagellar basal-body rod protein FlgF